jgi:hypothetical protein
LEALPRPQDTEPKQQQKTDLKHKESDRPRGVKGVSNCLIDLLVFQGINTSE